jgi:hypothetical protein
MMKVAADSEDADSWINPLRFVLPFIRVASGQVPEKAPLSGNPPLNPIRFPRIDFV